MRLLYSALFYCLLPFIVLRMLWRSRGAPDYRRRLGERFGLFSPRVGLDQPAIWVHAVSVGEILAAVALIEQLLRELPGRPLVVTTTTPTGSDRVRALFGERVFHVYAPWDTPGAVRRFLRRTRPQLLLLMETELWPNMLHYSHAGGCRILLANARMSGRSARGYARVEKLTRAMLGKLDTVACQSAADADRFVELGLAPRALQVTGSIKFDIELASELRERAQLLRAGLAMRLRPVVLAASTHRGEEEQILAAFALLRQQFSDCLLVLVPRHPERFEEVNSLCASAGWQVVRRSAGINPQAGDDIVLGDTVGELLLLYGAATVAVVGGSLVDHGGHNVLEPAAWGVPVVTGPHMENFTAIADSLVAAGAMIRLDDTARLGACLVELLGQPERCRQMGSAGRQVVADNRGASQRLLALVQDLLVGR